jgi:hypothetical protein
MVGFGCLHKSHIILESVVFSVLRCSSGEDRVGGCPHTMSGCGKTQVARTSSLHYQRLGVHIILEPKCVRDFGNNRIKKYHGSKEVLNAITSIVHSTEK